MSIHPPSCRHCVDGTEFTLYGFTTTHDGLPSGRDTKPYAVDGWGIHNLIATKRIPSDSEFLTAIAVCQRYNREHHGETWLTLSGEPAPWVCRRTGPNPGGTEPAVWAFFSGDEHTASWWLIAGQVDSIHPVHFEEVSA